MNQRDQRHLALMLVAASVGGAVIALTPYHSDINPDTMMVYFAALIKWTPFFWAQDRYGMLIPALTTWITDPFTNVIVQNAVHSAFALVAFALMTRALLPAARWIPTTLVAVGMHAAFSGEGDLMNFYVPWQIYTTSIALALAGLVFARRAPWSQLALFCLASYVNFSVFVFALPVAIARALARLDPRRPRRGLVTLARTLLVIAAGAEVGDLLRRGLGPTPGGAAYAPLPLRLALTGGFKIVRAAATDDRAHWALFVMPPLLGLTALFIARDRPSTKRIRFIYKQAAAAIAVALVYAVVVGASVFAKFNGYPRRYLIPSLMLWSIAWAALVVSAGPLERAGARGRAGLAAAVLVLFVLRLGTPGLGSARRSITTALGPLYDEVPPECTHVVGDYYRVWPVVFYARLLERPLWGISYRSEVTAEFWRIARFADPALCYWRDNEPEAFRFMASLAALGPFGHATERGPMMLLKRF